MNTTRIVRADDARLDDAAALFDDYRQLYGCAPDVAAAARFLRARLAGDEALLLVACAGDAPAGFVLLYPGFSSVTLARTLTVNDLYVRHAHRRRGVGRQLLDAAVTAARAAGVAQVSLSTEKANSLAQALYRSAGWTRDDQFVVYHVATGAVSRPATPP